MLLVMNRQMAGLCRRAALLSLLLSVGTSVDQNQLAKLIEDVLNKYRPTYMLPSGSRSFPMFSLAVSVPFSHDKQMYDIKKIKDAPDKVKEQILQCQVYTGENVVAATVLRWPNVLNQCPNQPVQWRDVLNKCLPRVKTWADVRCYCPDAFKDGRADHAEYRVVQKLHTLVKTKTKDDLLIFYILASPCNKKCTCIKGDGSILKKITEILNWKDYAIVFSNVFVPRTGDAIPEEDLRRSLWRLGNSKGRLGSIGLCNIFRCRKQTSGRGATCINCSDNGRVDRRCVSDEKPLHGAN